MNSSIQEIRKSRINGIYKSRPFANAIANAIEQFVGLVFATGTASKKIIIFLKWVFASLAISSVLGGITYLMPANRLVSIVAVSAANAIIFGIIWTMYARKEAKRKAAKKRAREFNYVERSQSRKPDHPSMNRPTNNRKG